MTSFNIVFAGTPEFILPSLQALYHSEHTLKAIYTQPDRRSGRGQHIQTSVAKQFALQHHIPVHQPEHFKSDESIATLAALKPDVMVVIAYGLILPQRVLDIPRLGCINVHASLLPRWRGASPIQHAILHGDTQTGVSIMQMDIGMDTGAVFNEVVYNIQPNETAESLHDHLANLAPTALLKTLKQLQNHTAQLVSQDNAMATYAPKINKTDALINWQHSANQIDQQIRAFYPWPIAFTHFNNQLLRIHQAQFVSTTCAEAPGTICDISKNGILVSASNGGILIERLQFPGSKVISASDWMNAQRDALPIGAILK